MCRPARLVQCVGHLHKCMYTLTKIIWSACAQNACPLYMCYSCTHWHICVHVQCIHAHMQLYMSCIFIPVHPLFSDPNFVRTFLMIYRSFCQPTELLDLLVERYRIPNPDGIVDQRDPITMKAMKRLKATYITPIQLRYLIWNMIWTLSAVEGLQ